MILETSDLGPRGGIKGRGKPLPWGFVLQENRARGKGAALKPPVAQRAGGISEKGYRAPFLEPQEHARLE